MTMQGANAEVERDPLDDKDNRTLEKMWVSVFVLSGLALGAVYLAASRNHNHGQHLGYTGPDRCRECHGAQFASWAETRMAGSFDVLRAGAATKAKEVAGLDPDADYTHDEECLPCHTTGYGLVGGFVSIEATPHMAGVTCEACHGPGGRYAGTVMNAEDPTFATAEARAAGLIYPPTQPVCAGCHNDDSPFVGMGYQFDYTQRVKAGTHEHFQLKYDHRSE